MSTARHHSYYLIGTTGFPNYGDELIAAAWLRYLAREAPDADVWLDCHSPGNAQLLLGHLHPRVRFVDTLWRVCWDAPSDDPWEVAAFAARALESPGVVARYVAGLELLRTMHTVHVIGGGYINDIWPRHVGLVAAAAGMSRRFGARGALTGAGLIPMAGDAAAILRQLTADFAVVDVRDAASAEILVGATESGDDALLDLGGRLRETSAQLPETGVHLPETGEHLPETGEHLPEAGRHLLDSRDSPDIMLCLQSDLVEGSLAWLAETALAAVRTWSSHGESVGFVECIPGPDRRLFDMLEPYLPGMRFYPFSEIWQEGFPARPGQRWLSTRFHPHLVASAAGASGVALPINREYVTLHESLVRSDSGWGVGPDAVQSGDHVSGSPERLDELSAAKHSVARAIYPPSPTPVKGVPVRPQKTIEEGTDGVRVTRVKSRW